MTPEQLQHALTVDGRIKHIKGILQTIRMRTKPTGRDVTPQKFEKDGHKLEINMGQLPLMVALPDHMAQKFLDEAERYLDGELLSLEREFTRI